MACTIDIDDLTRKFINDRPWFKTTDYRTIFIIDSPKERVNDNNFMAVAKRYAKEWNENLMEIIPELKSGIYYPRMELDTDLGKTMPAIKVFKADDVEQQLEIASQRIIKEREIYEQEILEEQAREVQREDAKRAGIEYDDDYLKDLEDSDVLNKIDMGNLTILELESFYENSSKSKDFITFVKDLKKMIAIWQNSGRTNEEILEMIKCL